MRGPLFWMSVPLLLPQAMGVRRTALRFGPAAGPTSGSAGEGPRRTLLALGDSIIAGVGASELSRALVGQTAGHLASLERTHVDWHAYGHIGFSTKKFLEHYEGGLPHADPDYIVISLGVNDVTSLTTGARWTAGLRQILLLCRETYARATIAVAGIPPFGIFPLLPEPLRTVIGRRGEAFDELARALIRGFPNTVHVPIDTDLAAGSFSADGFHPSEQGYVDFGRGVAEALLAAR